MSELAKITGPAAKEAAALPRRVVLLLSGLLAVFVVCAGGVTWVLVSQHGEISALSQESSTNAQTGRALADQVRALGAVPIVQPEAGPAGIPGAQGLSGSAGRDGVPGKDGEPGAAGRDGTNGVDGASAANGRDGVDGTDGVDGAAGADGVPGRDGADGAPGEQGADGPMGPQGPPGPTCPVGYTAQARQQLTETWWVCVADQATSDTRRR